MRDRRISGRKTTLGTCMAALLGAMLVAPSAMRAQQGPPSPAREGGPPPGGGRGPAMDPMLASTPPLRISDHVYALMGFPNIVFVVGTRATLVVDTGLGPRNGTIAAKDAAALHTGNLLYLTTTHFHPEHAAGEGGFPAATILIRDAVQEKELEDDKGAMVQMFAGMSAQNGALLRGVTFRKPDITFDKEMTVDLGGVTARLFWMGTAHTMGDELVDVQPDKTLISGDVVQNRMLPSLFGPNARLGSWINILSQLRPLQPAQIVPDHGALGDGSLLTSEYALLSDLQARALELKKQGKSADEAGKTILAEFKTKYSDWPNLDGIPGLVTHVYSENP
jgi:glyoxylase-like metal-dependent hydrolase (beta-lactamase superfamily II)